MLKHKKFIKNSKGMNNNNETKIEMNTFTKIRHEFVDIFLFYVILL